MNNQRSRTLQEMTTPAAPADVIAAAKTFFARQSGVYAAFVERESAAHLVLRGQGGEEIALAVQPDETGTIVSASSYLFDQQIARFFSSLPRTNTDTAA
jgi:hypothetical protein